VGGEGQGDEMREGERNSREERTTTWWSGRRENTLINTAISKCARCESLPGTGLSSIVTMKITPLSIFQSHKGLARGFGLMAGWSWVAS